MTRSLEARIRRLEQGLPPPVEVLLDDGTVTILPRGADMRLLVGVIAEARTGQTPPLVAEYADVIDHVVEQKDGSLLPLIRVLREGIQAQHDEHQAIEEVT